MSSRPIERARLGQLKKIGKGGQGVVYSAPNLKPVFTSSLVYKEYKPQIVADIDFNSLATMPAMLTNVLPELEARQLIAIAAWPVAIVEAAGHPTGFVMPSIPEPFYTDVKTVKGTERVIAEFQHLLNDALFLAERGIEVTDKQRLRLISEVAEALAFLHRRGVCVGDISPRNILFALSPAEAVYLVDCDGMRVRGRSAVPQVETPGWEVPPGEELATVYSDSYKLGLLALRLLVGDQDAVAAERLDKHTPDYLRRLIEDALDPSPSKRPLPTAWVSILNGVIQEWTPPTSVVGTRLAKPNRQTPVALRSRPTAGASLPARTVTPPAIPHQAAPQYQPQPRPVARPTPTSPSNSSPPMTPAQAGFLVFVALVFLFGLIVVIVAGAK